MFLSETHIITRLRKEQQRLEVQEQDRKFKEAELRDAELQRQKHEDKMIVEATQASKKHEIVSARNKALQRLADLPPEPLRTSVPRPIKIGVRLPDGSKVERFFVSNAKFQVLF